VKDEAITARRRETRCQRSEVEDQDRTMQTDQTDNQLRFSNPNPGTWPHLPPKSDRLLVQPPLLRIPDIGRDDLVERQLLLLIFPLFSFYTLFPLFISSRLHPPLIFPPALLRFEHLRILVRLDRQLAPDRILDIEDRLVDRIQGQRAPRFSAVRPGEVRTGLFGCWRWGEHGGGSSARR
jgi:hypothetical protein